MKTINYKEDFPLLITMQNPCGFPTGVPDFDFDVRLIAGFTDFMAGRRDGTLYNCRIEDDGRLCVLVDGHNLMPCAELKCEITYHVPDPSMPDGIRDLVKGYSTGISIVAGPARCDADSDCDCKAEFEALLPYIKGEDGKPGAPGMDGLSAYAQAVQGGYGGSEEEFAETLANWGQQDFITAADADKEIESIEPNIVTDSLRKTEQFLTPDEQKRVMKNLGNPDLRLFDDMWIRAGYMDGVHYSSVDRINHPDEPYILNGIPNSYEDALYIYQISAGITGDVTDNKVVRNLFMKVKCKTLFPLIVGPGKWVTLRQLYSQSSVEVIRIVAGSSAIPMGSNYSAFYQCNNLREIMPTIDYYVDDINAFIGCSNLEEVRIAMSGSTLNLKDSPKLSYTSVAFIINNRCGSVSTILTVTVHPNVYAKLTGDTSNAAVSALTDEEKEQWTALIPLAQSKNITFVTA